MWIGGRGTPKAGIFLIFTLGTVLMRSAGCAINDYADRSFDPHVAQHQGAATGHPGAFRPCETDSILFAVLAFSALMLALQLNKTTLLYAVVGGFLAITYPFVKRFLSVPQLYLGVTFGWGIPGRHLSHK